MYQEQARRKGKQRKNLQEQWTLIQAQERALQQNWNCEKVEWVKWKIAE